MKKLHMLLSSPLLRFFMKPKFQRNKNRYVQICHYTQRYYYLSAASAAAELDGSGPPSDVCSRAAFWRMIAVVPFDI